MNRYQAKKRKNKRRSGYALLVILMLAPLFFMLTATIMERVKVDLSFTRKDTKSKQAYYMAEAAEAAAMHELGQVTFEQHTHNSAGSALSGTDRLPITLPDMTIDSDGYTVWQWNPGDTHKSFTGSGHPEKFRYMTLTYETEKWLIRAEGMVGPDGPYQEKRVIEVRGATETAFQYALFGNDILSEFVRGANQTIIGKVHSNGKLYFRPSGSTLKIKSTKVSAAGEMVRFEDAWHRPDNGGTVKIENASGSYVTMPGKSQGANGMGNAYDSYHANWLNTDSSGAMAKWDARVIDGSLGQGRKDPPPLESFQPGGYYEQNANYVIDASTNNSWVTDAGFYNRAEDRYENVKDIDVSQLPTSSGGVVIYAKTPIRLVNAREFPCKTTIVACYNIYTKGHVNSVFKSEANMNNNVVTKKPLALMTTGRIYHLSGKWKDHENQTRTNTKRNAGNDEKFWMKTGYLDEYDNLAQYNDEKHVIEINAALVDGPPQVDEINYVQEWNGVVNSLYTGSDNAGTYCWANSDDFLENWGKKWSGYSRKIVCVKRGSIVHLENAEMTKFDNSDLGPAKTAWAYKTHYSPPIREYGYDPDLSNPLKQPPLCPVFSRTLLWRLVQ